MTKRALFLSGSPGDTRRYRVDHPAEALRLAGWQVRTRALEGVWDPSDVHPGEVLILHRVPWSSPVAQLIEACRAAGGNVLFDTDDLVFVPEAAERLARLRARGGATELGPASEFAAPEAYRSTLQAASGALVTTQPLAEAVAAAGRPAIVVRNAIDLELLRLSSEAWWAREASRADAIEDPTAPVVLGYASGTATHDRDFAVCAPAIQGLMRQEERISLRLFGPLSIGKGWEGLETRIEHVPYMDWRQLPEAMARLDVNLAPLELGDAFSRAKSELKFFEAGAVGVPTIASDTPAFRAAIADGENGLLARSEREWAEAIASLVDDARRRVHVGRAARATVVDRYVSDVRGPAMAEAIAQRSPGEGTADEGRFTGYAVGGGERSAHAGQPRDHATDAHAAFAIDDLPGLAAHAMGADYILERDAALDGRPLAPRGPWLAAWLARAGANVEHMRTPAIDPQVFYPGAPAERREPLVAADLRSADRSTRELAVRALAAARAADPSIRIVLFGRAPEPTPELDEVSWQAAFDAPDRAALLRRAAVLLDPSATNPLPALAEALACGCPVLTCDAAPTGQRQGLDSLAVLAPPQADALGARLTSLVRDASRRARLAETGLRAAERWSPGRTVGPIHGRDPQEVRAFDLPPGGWQLDQLQAQAEASGQALAPGQALSQSFECALDGLGRFGWRLAWPQEATPSGRLRLELRPADEGGSALAAPLRIMEHTLDEAGVAATGRGWTWFECEALDDSGKHRYVMSLSWVPEEEAGAGPAIERRAPRVRVLRTDRFAGGRTRVNGCVITQWTPAFATACRPKIDFRDPEPAQRPPPWAAAVDRMHVLAWRAGEDRQARDRLEGTLPFRLAETLARWGRPLPPMSERPWPTDASTAAKLLGTLGHYGPLALAREALSFLRWLRLSDNERATVMRRER